MNSQYERRRLSEIENKEWENAILHIPEHQEEQVLPYLDLKRGMIVYRIIFLNLVFSKAQTVLFVARM